MPTTTTMQRVMITIPPALLAQAEEMAAKLNLSRSRLIREALEQYLSAYRRQELRELLKEGYLYRAQESRQLAQEFLVAEQEASDLYVPWEE
jgi:metal-responsive CopG/Arc/MetJ family transcriptional regulator